MIKLFQFPSLWGLPNASPFCLKVETYLRMANLPFKIIPKRDPRKAPKGKFPYIEDDGKVVADSGFIIKYLKQKYGDTLDANLNATQKAQAIAIERMLEEHLYWVAVYSRWVDPNFWPETKRTFFGSAPLLMRVFISSLIQKKMIKALHYQGIGRHTSEEIYQLGLDDLVALNTLLNNHPFLLGDKPSSVDASGYAFIANILVPPIHSPLQAYVKAEKNFSNYCNEMAQLFYSGRSEAEQEDRLAKVT